MSLKVRKLAIQVADISDFGVASGVSKLVAGSGVSLSPASGLGTVTVTNSGVLQLLAGTGITLAPASGLGTVMITPAVSGIGAGTPTTVDASGQTAGVVTSASASDHKHQFANPVTAPGITLTTALLAFSGYPAPSAGIATFINANPGGALISAGTTNATFARFLGTLNLAGLAPIVRGMEFSVGLSNTGAAVALTDVRGINIGPPFLSGLGGGAGNTLINAYGAFIAAWTGAAANVPTTTNSWGIFVKPSGTNVTTSIGIEIAAPAVAATTNIGLQQDQAAATNRLAGKTRIGDTTIAPTRSFEINGSLAVLIVTQTANYTALVTDHYILGDATAAAITITLPASSASFANSVTQRLSIKKKDSSINAVTIAAAGADTIQGAATVALSTQYSERTLYTDGTGTWYVESTI